MALAKVIVCLGLFVPSCLVGVADGMATGIFEKEMGSFVEFSKNLKS